MTEYHKIQTLFKRDLSNKSKTLLEGVYSLAEFEYLKDNDWIFTEKVDGTNIQIIFDGENISFGGRTKHAQIPAELVNTLGTLFNPLREKMIDHFKNGCILCGEGYGGNIQKGGGNYRSDQSFVLFDVKIKDSWLSYDNLWDISETLKLCLVPAIGRGTLDNMIEMTRKGFDSAWGNFRAEGIVARPSNELQTIRGERIITKLKYTDFN
jgi:hypothetical protein